MAFRNWRPWTIAAGTLALIASVAFVAYAQSLGDLARLEAARRKAFKGFVKTYTNDTLPAVQSDTPPPGQLVPDVKPPAGAGPKPAPGAAAGTIEKPGAPSAAEQEKTPEFWQKRLGDLKDQRQRNVLYLEALQTRINALWADFTARDDPAQRALIGADRQKALEELDRLKKEQDDLDRKIEAIEEEARKAGVPPGWLR